MKDYLSTVWIVLDADHELLWAFRDRVQAENLAAFYEAENSATCKVFEGKIDGIFAAKIVKRPVKPELQNQLSD